MSPAADLSGSVFPRGDRSGRNRPNGDLVGGSKVGSLSQNEQLTRVDQYAAGGTACKASSLDKFASTAALSGHHVVGSRAEVPKDLWYLPLFMRLCTQL